MRIFDFNGFINEKLKIVPISDDDFHNIPDNLYRYHPETKKELKSIIEERIEKEGNKCNLNDIDTSAIIDMSGLFFRSNFNGDISQWDVSNVKSMNHMFYDARSFNGDLSKWDVSNVEDMLCMLGYAKKFNGDISGWNVSNVKTMGGMFYRAQSFKCDISKWDVSNVENMQFMFDCATSFDADISGWDVSKVKKHMYMFERGCPLKEQPEKQPKFNI